ncbi:MAG: glycosyltransferase family 39 protein [Bacteroidota bacterium]|nr:glycosyltransferase family 39 protein [Bacteroidota bacterium]
MKPFIDYFRNNPKYIYLLAGILVLPALLIHLGLMPFINDEAIRATVALEMILRHNYIVPYMGGVLYFNKPPLFNWILIFFFRLAGNFTEFTERMPTIIFLLIFLYTIFYVTKKHFGTFKGFVAALMFLTCGRILFYDSLLGLIDITFSWVVYLNFMLIYYFFSKEKYYLLFICSYALTAAAFLMKGLPAVAFQGITLLTLFIYHKNFKKLFSIPHFTGIFIFLIITGAYYFAYYKSNPGSILVVFENLLNESTKKTAVQMGFLKTIIHLFTFPVEITYHFFPWSLMIVLLFSKNVWKRIKSDPFILYCSLIFLANILIYWISPDTYPRYLFMLIPLLFTVLFYLFDEHEKNNTLNYKILNVLLIITAVILTLAQAAYPFVPSTRKVGYAIPASIILLIFSASLLWLFFKTKKFRLAILAILLLVVRIGFNWFILPVRQAEAPEIICKENAVQVARQTKNDRLYMSYEDIDESTLFYFTRERMQALEWKKRQSDGYTLIHDPYKAYKNQYTHYFDVLIRKKHQTVSLVKYHPDCR